MERVLLFSVSLSRPLPPFFTVIVVLSNGTVPSKSRRDLSESSFRGDIFFPFFYVPPTKCIVKENVWLSEASRFHIKRQRSRGLGVVDSREPARARGTR